MENTYHYDNYAFRYGFDVTVVESTLKEGRDHGNNSIDRFSVLFIALF